MTIVWYQLPVRFDPEDTCRKKLSKKRQAIKAARAIYLLREFEGKQRVTVAVIVSPMHYSPVGENNDPKEHVTVSYRDNNNNTIITLHAYKDDITEAYGGNTPQ